MPGDGLTHGPPAIRKAGGRYHRFSRINRHSLRDGLTAYNALSPGTGLSCSRRLRFIIRRLDLSVGRPGPHAFAVRDEPRSSDVLIAPIAFPSNARDDAFAPLMDGNGPIIMLIYRNLQVRYFCARGWTTFSRTRSSGKSPPPAVPVSRRWTGNR
jgi:hypothetical protein